MEPEILDELFDPDPQEDDTPKSRGIQGYQLEKQLIGTEQSLARLYNEVNEKKLWVFKRNLFRNFKGRYWLSKNNQEEGHIPIIKSWSKKIKDHTFEYAAALVTKAERAMFRD